MSDLKLKLRKISPIKYALLAGIMSAIFIFIMLLFASLYGSFYFGSFGILGMLIAEGGVKTFIITPIVFFILGFIFSLIAIFILNFLLKQMGGLVIDFEKISGSDDITMIGKD